MKGKEEMINEEEGGGDGEGSRKEDTRRLTALL